MRSDKFCCTSGSNEVVFCDIKSHKKYCNCKDHRENTELKDKEESFDVNCNDIDAMTHKNKEIARGIEQNNNKSFLVHLNEEENKSSDVKKEQRKNIATEKLDESEESSSAMQNHIPKFDLIGTNLDYFAENQENKHFKCQERAAMAKKSIINLDTAQIEKSKNYIKKLTTDLSLEWPALFGAKPKTIYVHCDLDAFYASCEIIEKPEYANIPLGVGSLLMLATCNYEARKYGIKAGMPGYMAKKLCPQLVITKADFQKYNFYSEAVMRLLAIYDLYIEVYGVDEACMKFDREKLRYAYSVWRNGGEAGRYADDEDFIEDYDKNIESCKEEECNEFFTDKNEFIDSSCEPQKDQISNAYTDYDTIKTQESANVLKKEEIKINDFVSTNTAGDCSFSLRVHNDIDADVKNGQINEQGSKTYIFDGQLTFANVAWIVDKIRKVIHRNTCLTISAGISVCRGLAKYGSDINKPNGQYIIEKDFDDFLRNLKVDEINGIGKRRKTMLEQTLQIKTIGDLRDNHHFLYFMFREKTFLSFFRLSFGLICFDTPKSVDKTNYIKSKGRDVTFPTINDYNFFCDVLWDASCELESGLKKSNFAGFVVTLRIRYHDFTTFTKQSKFIRPVFKDYEIFNAAYKIFCDVFSIKDRNIFDTGLDQIRGITMLGIRISDMVQQNQLETIYGFKSNTNKNVKRICPMCDFVFFIEPQTSVERHVEKCMQRKVKKEKLQKRSILYFCNKKVKET